LAGAAVTGDVNAGAVVAGAVDAGAVDAGAAFATPVFADELEIGRVTDGPEFSGGARFDTGIREIAGVACVGRPAGFNGFGGMTGGASLGDFWL